MFFCSFLNPNPLLTSSFGLFYYEDAAGRRGGLGLAGSVWQYHSHNEKKKNLEA
jgi:hypothetical protein